VVAVRAPAAEEEHSARVAEGAMAPAEGCGARGVVVATALAAAEEHMARGAEEMTALATAEEHTARRAEATTASAASESMVALSAAMARGEVRGSVLWAATRTPRMGCIAGIAGRSTSVTSPLDGPHTSSSTLRVAWWATVVAVTATVVAATVMGSRRA
jgi:hypothetical protein